MASYDIRVRFPHLEVIQGSTRYAREQGWGAMDRQDKLDRFGDFIEKVFDGILEHARSHHKDEKDPNFYCYDLLIKSTSKIDSGLRQVKRYCPNAEVEDESEWMRGINESKTSQLVRTLLKGNVMEATRLFDAEIRTRIADALEVRKIQVGKKLAVKEGRQHWCVVYRRGGTANFTWHRSVAFDDKAKAEKALADTKRMGYAAYLVDYEQSMKIGLPDTYAPGDKLEQIAEGRQVVAEVFGNNLGLHIIKNPVGTFSFVGNVPRILGKEVPATTNDIMGGRSYKNADGDVVTTKFTPFQTADAAVAHAKSKGVKLCSSPTCSCRELF